MINRNDQVVAYKFQAYLQKYPKSLKQSIICSYFHQQMMKRPNQVCSLSIRHEEFNIAFKMTKNYSSLLIVAQNVETSEKFIRSLDKTFIAQQGQFIQQVFEQPQDILEYLITNYSSITFQDSFLKFQYEYAGKKQKVKEISIKMQRKKSKYQEKQVADQLRDSKIKDLEVKCKDLEQSLSVQKKNLSQTKGSMKSFQKKVQILQQRQQKYAYDVSLLHLNQKIWYHKLSKKSQNDDSSSSDEEEEEEEMQNGMPLIKWTKIKDINLKVPYFNIIAQVKSVYKVKKNEVKVTLQDKTGKITAYLEWSKVLCENKYVALYKAETRSDYKGKAELDNAENIYSFETFQNAQESIQSEISQNHNCNAEDLEDW